MFLRPTDDVANAWATSVSSRSISYRWAMVLCLIFEMTGALAVGARTASTIKNGIIPIESFEGNAGVQLLAFACASAGAATWVMWCTRNNAHVSSTYSLISSIAGVGVAVAGAGGVSWGWNDGQGLGAIFAGLGMAPAISGCFAAIIFMLVKVVVHMRKNPVPWAVWTSPFFFLIAGTVCTLSIVYKGSPRLGLTKKSPGWIAGVSVGTGFALFFLAAIFFVPFVHAKVIKKDYTVKVWEVIKGPLLWRRAPPADAEFARVPNYAVVQHDSDSDDEGGVRAPDAIEKKTPSTNSGDEASPKDTLATTEAAQVQHEVTHAEYKQLLKDAEAKHHAKLRKSKSPLGWAMRTLHNNPIGAGSVYEKHNVLAHLRRLPAYPVIALMYGLHYDIHSAQVGIMGTPEGRRMERVYSHATKYPNEVEYLYSFVQIITACTASFAHGANDVGNAVGVWAGMYVAWSKARPSEAKEDVPLWQIAVVALTICIGFITYGYNIMKGKSIVSRRRSYDDLSANNSNSHGQQDHLPLPQPWLLHGDGCRHHHSRLLPVQAARLDLHVHHWRHRRCRSLQRHFPRRQLAASRSPRLLLDYDHPHRRSHRWLPGRPCPQRPSLLIDVG